MMKYKCVYTLEVEVSVDMNSVNPEVKEMFDDGELNERGIAEMIARHRLHGLLENSEVGVDVLSVEPNFTEEELSMTKLRVVYVPYERYCADLSVRIGHIKAPTLKSALLEMLNRVDIYMDEESIAEEEVEYGNEVTADEIISRIRRRNGDGCDTIVSILDEYTGIEYMADNESELKLKEWYNYNPDN